MNATARGPVILLTLLITALPAAADEARAFPLKSGDTWVMAGDSITAQKLHSNYFEAFCYARYPKLTFRFRNSGVGGDTIPKVLARYDWDVNAWKPSVVSVELGMNDQGGYSVEQYIANMKKLDERIRASGARPIYFTASPINNGDTHAKIGGNAKLQKFAQALKEFADQQKAPFANQFDAVIDIWGQNKPKENVARLLPMVKAAAQDEKLAGIEHLRAFLAAQEKSPEKLVSMQGDPVHPGAPGQLMMAAALLKELGANPFVSSVELDSAGKVTASKGCTIENAKADGGKLLFERLDEALPFPVPDDARDVLPLYPTIVDLSQYTLKVTGLAKGMYSLKANNEELGTVSAEQLEKGLNLTTFGKGPIAAQSKQILAAVSAKEGAVAAWRGLSKKAADANSDDARKALEAQTKKVELADDAIRAAAKPKALKFELAPMK